MLTGEINAGVPPFKAPPFSIPANATGEGPEHEISFSGMLSELGSAIIIIPIIAILESIAIAKAFCMDFAFTLYHLDFCFQPVERP